MPEILVALGPDVRAASDSQPDEDSLPRADVLDPTDAYLIGLQPEPVDSSISDFSDEETVVIGPVALQTPVSYKIKTVDLLARSLQPSPGEATSNAHLSSTEASYVRANWRLIYQAVAMRRRGERTVLPMENPNSIGLAVRAGAVVLADVLLGVERPASEWRQLQVHRKLYDAIFQLDGEESSRASFRRARHDSIATGPLAFLEYILEWADYDDGLQFTGLVRRMLEENGAQV